MKARGYDNKLFALVDRENGEVEVGSRVMSFRGEETVVIGASAPHKPASTGRVHTTLGEFFPSVFDLKWVEV